MNPGSQAVDKISQSSCAVGANMGGRQIAPRMTVSKMIASKTIAAVFLLVATAHSALAQQSSQPAAQTGQTAQQGGSLADVARQARAQKQAQPSPEANRAQQVADQLAEDQDDKDAPAGLRTYNAGDYKLWVPAPYTVAGNDDAGVVLSGAPVGSTRAMVLIGNPIVIKFGQNEGAFHEAATQFARTYLQSAKCAPASVSNHSAYQCGLAGANLLGRSVSGQAVVIRGASNMFPVMCVAPTDSRSRDILNNPHSSYNMKRSARLALEREDQDLRGVWQKCESVLQSIHLKDDGAKLAVTTTSVKAGTASIRSADFKPGAANLVAAPQQAATASGNAPDAAANAAPAGNAGGPPSLADIARRIHQPTAQQGAVSSAPASNAANAPAANVGAATVVAPAGFKTQAFNYCKGTAQPCWDGSIVVPADSQLVSSECKQYAFEIKFKGAPLLLLAGSGNSDGCAARSANDPNLMRWNLLVEPENRRAPGTYVTISSQQTQLDGKTALITEMGFKNGMADWMGKRAEVEANGVQIVVGCMAPRENFADADAICTGLIGSLRLP